VKVDPAFPLAGRAASLRATNLKKKAAAMPGPIETRLAEMGVTLPDAPAPAANYVPFVIVGDIVYVSGQVSSDADGFIRGKVGVDMTTEEGAAAARRCAISLLAQVRAACGGDIDRLVRVVKLTGFVNSTPDYTDQPKVVNGCSDFLVEALGDAGRHARSAVSAGALPLGVAVEIEGIFQIRP
jgi:enamine deaminase RidA (YjgF/YER057c/UK114 family)